jgi:hypothetical protein
MASRRGGDGGGAGGGRGGTRWVFLDRYQRRLECSVALYAKELGALVCHI